MLLLSLPSERVVNGGDSVFTRFVVLCVRSGVTS